MHIPFNKPSFEIDSIKHMNDCFKANRFSGNGLFSNEAEKILDIIHSSGKSLLTQSCTQALELSLQNIELKPGDEVILPSFTFIIFLTFNNFYNFHTGTIAFSNYTENIQTLNKFTK
jgi:dTDP-4-amino-4,6-dideoxygalactose transaminase